MRTQVAIWIFTVALTFTLCVRPEQLVPIISGIAATHFPAGRLVLVSPGTSDDWRLEVVRVLHEAALWPIAMAGLGSKFEAASVELATSALLLLDQGNYTVQMETLSQHQVWFPRVRLLVVETTSTTEPHELAKTILDNLWQRWRAANVAVIVPTLEIFAWRPYDASSHCGGPVKHVVKLDQKDIFPGTVPRNLHDCKVNVVTFVAPPFVIAPKYRDVHEDVANKSFANDPAITVDYNEGLEIQLLKTVAEVTNFRLNILTIKPGNWTVMVKYTIDGVAEVAMACIPLYWHFQKAELTRAYLSLPITWMTPMQKPIPHWKSLTRVFSPVFWLLVAISFTLTMVTLLLLGLFGAKSEHEVYLRPVPVLLVTLEVILGLPVPEPRTFLLRIFLLLWIVYSMQINTAYQSKLIAVLGHEALEPPIENVQDLLASGIEFGFSKRMVPIMESINEGQYDEILKQFHDITKLFMQNMDRVAEEQDFAIFTIRMFAEYAIMSKYTIGGQPKARLMKENAFSTTIHMCLSPGSLLLPRFDAIITRVLEAGLMDFWWDVMKQQFIKTGGETDDFHIVLTTMHLQPAFQLLLVGLCCSVIGFLGEIVYQRFTLYKSRSSKSYACRRVVLWMKK